VAERRRAPARERPAEERAPEIVRRLDDAYPEATVALHATNPLEILVATILSAQCTDARVNKVTETLFAKYRGPEDYLRVPEAELAADIRPTGFFNQKTRSIRGACTAIVREHGGEVPRTMTELVALPGVGRKTANIVLANGFGVVQGIAVDTHVKRLANRLGLSTEHDPDKIERDLMRLVPKGEWFSFTYKLIDHGRAVCVARKPRCGECVVADLCPSSSV
jgi:endonuclease III